MSWNNFDQLSVLYSKIEKNRGGGIYTPDFQGVSEGVFSDYPPPFGTPGLIPNQICPKCIGAATFKFDLLL